MVSNKSSGASNKQLPYNKSIPLGIQHVLAMFAGNITVPIIIAGVFGQTPEQKIFLIQMALFVAGVATVIQLLLKKYAGCFPEKDKRKEKPWISNALIKHEGQIINQDITAEYIERNLLNINLKKRSIWVK